MTNIENTYEQEFAEAIRDCLTKLADISRRMGDDYRGMEKNIATMEHQLDRAQEKADISQRRETDLVDENQRLREENARLRGEFQIVSDTAHRASMGAQISRRLSEGQKPFSDEPWASNAVPGGHKGPAYQAVLADAQDNARAVENMAPEFLRALEKELANPQGA